MNDSNRTAFTGLSDAEAGRRLAQDGPNALPDGGRRGWAAIARDAAREPMFLLLAGAALLYLMLGEPRESLFLLAMVLLMLGMTLYQEGRTERALAALRDLSAPAATVLRGGQRRRIPASSLVRGDLLLLAEGDRVPADALLLDGGGLAVDESLLTGESVPVAKRPGPEDTPAAEPGGEASCWVFAGTLVVQGEALARVGATGARSQLGRIGAALATIDAPRGRLQRETQSLAQRLALLGLGVSLLLVLVIGLRGGGWLQALLAGVALSMSVLPEEFPVVLTVFPAIGAWRLARRNVLTRRLAAIEILGSTSVLCVDKTGTLTENRMALQRLWAGGAGQEYTPGTALAPALRALLSAAVHASRPRSPDPIDRALGLAGLPGEAGDGAAPVLLREYGLSASRPALIRVRRENGGIVAAAKGAPETVIAMCREGERAAALAAAAAMGRQGLRVLAVAEARGLALPLPEDPAALPYRLLGLVALADPLRDDIPAAVADCRRAGVRVVMITGDHPETAAAIARQAGLENGATLTGPEIARLAPPELAARLDGVAVCARIVPEQKLAIVRALQSRGAVVAMTGDGVNDAPALRAADVGVAMGRRGTDVAREAAELTLLDDRFASLVEALRAGRRIFSNMRKSMGYVTAIHVPITLLALLPPLMGWPVLLFPLHIVFLELVIDPACSLAFENEPDDADLMRRPPRPHGEALLGRAAIVSALLRGLWAALLVVACYGAALAVLPEGAARATAFSALLLCNLGLLFSYRQRGGSAGVHASANPLFAAIAGVALALLALCLFVPAAASLMRFSPPPAEWIAAAAGVAVLMIAGIELGRRR
ncbi:cation-translocating P-type ATPase [Massilia sp. 9I]|uniref:cation-translocating P-type ATPase n=1 Tax=Massilia sp. 9I TaxID=2653152 RepID=UPI0012F0F4C2|nr:cation-translocating P-type ATPase [Massilia sp. 9I]VXB98466.1 Ca2+-transporting ATPase [Massilia sp. 9I]